MSEWGLVGGTSDDFIMMLRAAATSQKIYRGINIEHGAIPPNYEGDGILDHLQNSHYEEDVGLGRHWTTNPQVALNSMGNWGHKVLLEGTHDGTGIDPDSTDTHGHWADEQEVTLLPDTPVAIHSVKVQHPHTGEWQERLSPGWRGVEHTAEYIVAARRYTGMSKMQRPWSDQGYPLQHHDTKHLVDMFHNFRDLHNSGEPGDDWNARANNYAAELLDRHEAGDPEATKWADRHSYAAPDYMDHDEWLKNKEFYPEDYPTDPRV